MDPQAFYALGAEFAANGMGWQAIRIASFPSITALRSFLAGWEEKAQELADLKAGQIVKPVAS